jgi:D-xylose transport system substrate-binding protein
MRKRSLMTVTALAVAAVALAACSSSSSGGTSAAPSSSTPAASTSTSTPVTSSSAPSSSAPTSSAPAALGEVGVILPDTKSSARWEADDRPSLSKAFTAAGIKSDIQNAQGDIPKWGQICDAMINEGVKVLIDVDLDAPSGAACLKKAKAAGIKTIDYDRLTLGGGADYYVSFDNVQVGKLQGEGLIKCLTDEKLTKANIVYINGAATDNNATLFKQGYVEALASKISSGDYKLVGDATGKWDPNVAQTVWQQFYTAQKGKIDGAIVANDGMGGGVAAAMKQEGVLGKIPFTGQDATDDGLNRVLLGQQCMTVFKDTNLEAALASKIAIALIKGESAASIATSTVDDTVLNTKVPFAAATPVAIYKDNVKDVITAGYTTAAKICTGAAAAVCKSEGIS